MTQSPIEPHHKDMAAKAAGFSSYDRKAIGYGSDHSTVKSILAHAQTLANLEKARADLAEIDRIAVAGGFAQCLPGDPCLEIAAIAAPYRANTPAPPPVTECPKCEVFGREVSDAAAGLIRMTEESCTTLWQGVTRDALSRFIIPASDPVAEALREALTGANLLTDSELAEHFAEVFAERGLEIVERRDR